MRMSAEIIDDDGAGPSAEPAEPRDTEQLDSVRPDGSVRPPIHVREGYVPPDEESKYVAPRPQRLRGECITWNAKLGWGFIRPDDLSKNLFVHKEWMIDNLKPGDLVECERLPAQKGDRADRAMNVRVYKAAGATKAVNTSSTDGARGTASFVPRSVAARSNSASKRESGTAGSRPTKRQATPEASVLGYP